MTIQISTAEELVRSHLNLIAQEKKRLVDSIQRQVPLPKSLVNILTAISTRQNHIVRRVQLLGKRKLSFFDDAPMAMDEVAETIGAMSQLPSVTFYRRHRSSKSNRIYHQDN